MAATSTMSKKRYNDFATCLRNHIRDDETTNLILSDLRKIMNFDPNTSRYTPELAQKEKERRHKLRDEQGISTYISSGLKTFREKQKIFKE